MSRILAFLRDLRAGFGLAAAARAFRDYWSPAAVATRLDEWTADIRRNTGKPPDPAVERRRAERRDRLAADLARTRGLTLEQAEDRLRRTLGPR